VTGSTGRLAWRRLCTCATGCGSRASFSRWAWRARRPPGSCGGARGGCASGQGGTGGGGLAALPDLPRSGRPPAVGRKELAKAMLDISRAPACRWAQGARQGNAGHIAGVRRARQGAIHDHRRLGGRMPPRHGQEDHARARRLTGASPRPGASLTMHANCGHGVPAPRAAAGPARRRAPAPPLCAARRLGRRRTRCTVSPGLRAPA